MNIAVSALFVVPAFKSLYVTQVESINDPVNYENGIAIWGPLVPYIVIGGIVGAV